MRDEPEIIKKLRKEEKLGKLQTRIQSDYKSLEMLEELSKDVENENLLVEEDDLKFQKIKDNTLWEMTTDELYRNMIEMISDAIIIVDLKGVILYCNTVALRMVGYSEEEYVGKHFSELGIFRKQDIPKFLKIFATILREKAIPPIEFIFHHKDGTTRWGEGRADLLKKNRKILGIQVIVRDITDRKQDKDELREFRGYFQRMFNSLADPVVIVNSKGKFLEINNKVEEVTGFTREELLGKNFLRTKIATKKSKGILIKNLAKRMIGVDIAPYEIEVLTKDGKKLPYEVNAAKITYKGKAADMVVFRDITKRKKAEEEIKRARDDYLRITNLTGDIIVKVDIEGRWTFLNDIACEFWGKSRKELIGRAFADYLHPDDLEKTMAAIEEVKSNKIKKIVINRQKTPMGWRIVEWNGAGIYDMEGRYIGFQATGRDITERKKMEMKVKENEIKYRRIFENANDGFIYLDKSGKITDVNEKAVEIFGGSVKELIGKHFTKVGIFHSRDLPKLIGNFMDILRGKKVYLEVSLNNKQGKQIHLACSSAIIKSEYKYGKILVVVHDITARKKAEEQLKEAHEKLKLFNSELEKKVKERTIEVENLLRQKDEFINQLSHDLGSPLTPLTALLPLMEEKEKDPQLKEELGVIHRNVKYLNALVDKTIELAKLNSPETKLSLETTNLLHEIKAVIKNNKLVFEENELEILDRVDESIKIMADKSMLRTLFDNIISNAVKYSPHGGTITIDAQDDGEWITVSIKDTGIGMTKEEVNHIFEEFYKADWSRHDHMSSGLGLSICKSIVKKHGGHIWAESLGKDKGTTMFFTIPSSSK